jgi:hypothetical protein
MLNQENDNATKYQFYEIEQQHLKVGYFLCTGFYPFLANQSYGFVHVSHFLRQRFLPRYSIMASQKNCV